MSERPIFGLPTFNPRRPQLYKATLSVFANNFSKSNSTQNKAPETFCPKEHSGTEYNSMDGAGCFLYLKKWWDISGPSIHRTLIGVGVWLFLPHYRVVMTLVKEVWNGSRDEALRWLGWTDYTTNFEFSGFAELCQLHRAWPLSRHSTSLVLQCNVARTIKA